MKKTLLLIATVLCCAMTMFAQNNNTISYQAVVRDTENKLVANKDVTVTVKIFDGDATTAAYTETQTVTTNLNGLISLMIGPDVETPAWNSIQWNQARIVTTVTLDNTPLGTLAMPMTAVPYAFYADKINPNSPMITDIYDKMQDDSTALADKMQADSTALHGALKDTARDIRGAITITNETLAALQDRVNTFNTTFCDSLKTCDVIKDMRDSIQDNAAAIAANATAMNSADAALDARIEADSNRLVALKNRVNTFNTTFCDSLKTCDVIINMRDSIKNNATAIGGKADTGNVYTRTIIDDKLALKANSAELATVATSGSYKNLTDTPTNVAYTNASNIFIGDNTFSGSSTFSGDITISANSVSVTCGDTPKNLCTLLNELYNEITELKNDKVTMNKRIDTLKNRADSLKNFADSLADVMKAMVLYVPQEQKTVIIQAGEDQTENTYIIPFNFGDRKPNPNSAIWMYINGVMVGGNHNNVIKVTTDSVSGDKVLTYDATNNGGYKLKKDDKVTVVYWISPAND